MGHLVPPVAAAAAFSPLRNFSLSLSLTHTHTHTHTQTHTQLQSHAATLLLLLFVTATQTRVCRRRMSVCLWVTSDDRDSACGFPLLETGDGDSFTCRRPHCDTQMHVFIDTNAHSLLHRCAKHALSCPWFPRREACQLPNTTQTHSKLFFFCFCLPLTLIF